MKKFLLKSLFFLFPLFSLGSSELQLSPVENGKIKERTLSLPGNHILYFFTDGTIAYVHRPPLQQQSWPEWWNNTLPRQPDPQFYFDLTHWSDSSSFQLYRYEWRPCCTSHCLEPLFKNGQMDSQFPYFIQNCETGELTLCQIWSLDDLTSFIERYGKEQYSRGYNDGSAGCR